MSPVPALPAAPSLTPTRTSCRARFVTWRARTGRDDAGWTLAETLVVCLLAGILATIGGSLMHSMNVRQKEANERVEITTGTSDAVGQLERDITDGMAIRLADEQHLTIAVIRDRACNVRAYTADPDSGTFSVTTEFFEGESCSGASESSTKVLIERYTQTSTFTYWGESPTIPIPAPVEDLRNIRLVQYALTAEPYIDRDAPDYELGTRVFFDGRGESSGSGAPELQAKRPALTLTTAIPGRDAPVLTWTDATPTLTQGWVVTRAREPEGSKPGAFLAIAWPAAKTLTFTDTSLQPGERASYVVYAVLTDGSYGPSSNSVDTGLRPAAPTDVVAVGSTTSSTVSWHASVGGTSYDVYRDDVLVANVGNVTTYVDPLTYGRSHAYRVVATNRFEQRLTTGTESGRVPLGAAIDTEYPGGTRLASAVTPAAGAFTAPPAPTLTATPTTTWSTTVAWDQHAAAWVGAGPTTKDGRPRVEVWDVTTHQDSGATTALWTATPAATTTRSHGSRTPGSTDFYEARSCNASGCSPWGATVAAIQRPPAPATCTTAGASTRGMQVTVNPAAMEAPATGYRVAGGVGTPTGGAAQPSPIFNIDQLAHATTHTFTAATQNGSPANDGWSDDTACQGTTATLGVAITGTSATTRTISASMSVTNGSSSSLTLEGVRTDQNVGSASWDPLADGTGFTVTARNGDGYNSVVAQAAVSTQTLAAPATPTCTVTVVDGDAPGSITISGGDQVRLGSSGSASASPHTYGSLDAGTFVGYARRLVSDGFNSSYSGWDGCPSATIADPYPSPWGTSAPGCPKIASYISATSPTNWQNQRTSAATCGLRWYVTSYGENESQSAGDVVSTGTYTIGSGATAYSLKSGNSPMGPLAW